MAIAASRTKEDVPRGLGSSPSPKLGPGGSGFGRNGMFALAVIPPSIVRMVPLIHEAACSEARNATASATPWTSPILPTGR
eukprot:CAMPEP_0205915724 /NCGR_PEP_ID=MMETSP1325-20131115/8050_1 /ASSEMBLY_ACC=CAM_ASM_000708 /TAXON_ID=236786 /ORGANISM="Florenciella sp., Strain RCC1007" /LENGTH=80 /DNA_ID=CAMNT_0053282931 /DNA_START=62 /DNA_END=305 /DNA_ORIENTATION=-